MSLTEGKNREVRNVLAHLGLRVSRLIRIAYGPLTFDGLEPGDADEVSSRRTRSVPQDSQVRIIAGQWRGRPLEAPPGPATRPTADRVRETLFSMLASRLGSFRGLARGRSVRRERCARASKLCRAAQRRRPSSKMTRTAGAIIKRNAEKLGAAIQLLAGSALRLAAFRPVRPDPCRPALCCGVGHFCRPIRAKCRAGLRRAVG